MVPFMGEPITGRSGIARAYNGITQTHTFYTRKARATPMVTYIRNLQQHSPTVYKLLYISPTHESMIGCVKLESAIIRGGSKTVNRSLVAAPNIFFHKGILEPSGCAQPPPIQVLPPRKTERCGPASVRRCGP